MSPVEHVELRTGAYHDSVTLLQVSRAVADVDGVLAAQVAMATPLNVEVLQGMGFAVPEQAGPSDLMVAVRADDDAAVEAALAALVVALTPATSSSGPSVLEPPRTTGVALRREPAPLVLVSVPGPSAAAEAMDAIAAGSSVMVFSDNVSVEEEVALKDAAASQDVLVMGPDCGTAVVGGVGLGFANVVRPGPVSLVAASGTGAQHLLALLDHAGVGVRHCLGVGGRDLSAAVAGRSARQALTALADDEESELVVVVSKPADPGVLAELEALVADLGVAVQWATLGSGRPDLSEAAQAVLARVGVAEVRWPHWPAAEPQPRSPGRALRGLFCGGTLCDEAMLVAGRQLGAIRSNIPLSPDLALDVRGDGGWDGGTDHAMVDFGDDALTSGRAHPMIDPSLRDQRLAREAADPAVGAVLLDVVLGHGSHADPAGELAPAITAARRAALDQGRHLGVVVSLTGTIGDPQGRDDQAARLAAAGADVYLSNAEAARAAAALVSTGEAS
ncbi:FdrA family protein [Angustibacter sp. McL0619]|uniref:FdrA family protein n=1 Tax=Angustibacter sp. McL0619 TaxID=3415676 RepID=UPI003CEBE409